MKEGENEKGEKKLGEKTVKEGRKDHNEMGK